MNELVKPTLNIDLDIELPKIEPIKHNLGAIETMVANLDNFYEHLVFTKDQYDEAKSENTKINKLKQEIADNRKKTIAQYKEPIDDFEKTSKRIEKALDEIHSKIAGKIEVFDLEEQKKKELKINELIESIRQEYMKDFSEYNKVLSEYVITFNNRWYNKTYKTKDMEVDIREQFNEKIDDLDAFKKDAETIANYFNAIDTKGVLNKEKYVERYKYTRDVNSVLNDIKMDLDNLNKKEEPKPVVNNEPIIDPFEGLSINKVVKVPFKIYVGEDKLEAFKRFAKENDIEIEEIK